MPALPDVANVIRARLFFTLQGKTNQGLRVFYFYSGTAPTVTNMNAFATTFLTQANTSLPGVMNAQNAVTGCTLEDLSASTGAVGEATGNTAGTLTGEPVPPSTAVVASYEIARRYRGGHPRSYWPLGSYQELGDNGLWSPSFITSAQTAIDAVVNSLIGAVEGSCTIEDHVNVSYYEGFTSVENPITHRYRNVPTLRGTPLTDVISNIVAQPYYGSIRRRREKTSS